MTDAALRAPPAAPDTPLRIILEQRPGSHMLSAEYYVNGTRAQVLLTPGFETFELKDIFARLLRDREACAVRKAQRQEAEAASRHRRVYDTTAFNHGTYFANRTVGSRELRSPATLRVPAGAILSSLDLL